MPVGTVVLARLAASWTLTMIMKNKVIILEPRAVWTAGVAHNPPLDKQALLRVKGVRQMSVSFG